MIINFLYNILPEIYVQVKSTYAILTTIRIFNAHIS